MRHIISATLSLVTFRPSEMTLKETFLKMRTIRLNHRSCCVGALCAHLGGFFIFLVFILRQPPSKVSGKIARVPLSNQDVFILKSESRSASGAESVVTADEALYFTDTGSDGPTTQPPNDIFDPHSSINNVKSVCGNRDQKNHVLLFAYFRSGSSFTGELLASSRKVFYMFEPLHILADDVPPTFKVYFLRQLFLCNLRDMLQHYTNDRWLQVALNWGNPYSSVKKRYSSDLSVLTQQCCEASHVVIKTIRMTLPNTAPLYESFPRGTFRVVHLVRDPRAVFVSRRQVPGDTNNAASVRAMAYLAIYYRRHCAEVMKDLRYGDTLTARGDPYTVVKYEQLATDTLKYGVNLYRVAGISDPSISSIVRQFVQSHDVTALARRAEPTLGDRLNRTTFQQLLDKRMSNSMSTLRDSAVTATRWREKVSSQVLRNMNIICEDLLNKVHYDW